MELKQRGLGSFLHLRMNKRNKKKKQLNSLKETKTKIKEHETKRKRKKSAWGRGDLRTHRHIRIDLSRISNLEVFEIVCVPLRKPV